MRYWDAAVWHPNIFAQVWTLAAYDEVESAA